MRKKSIYVATAIVTTIIFASCASNGLPRYDERPYNKPMTLVKAAGEDYVISDYESFALYSDPLFVDTTDLGTRWKTFPWTLAASYRAPRTGISDLYLSSRHFPRKSKR